MDLPRETKILFLLGLILLNLAVRFPTDGDFREHRVDTFNLHAMAESVEDTNEAKWVAHPLSVFGLYPYSYPSLPILLVAAIAMLSGLSTELSVFVLAQLVGLMAIGAGYLLGSEIRDDFKYRYLMAAFISLAPALTYETIWAVPKRGLFMLEFTLLFWLLLRFRHTNRDIRYIPLMALVLVSMAATHRMFLLMPLMFAAYIAVVIMLALWRRIHIVFRSGTTLTAVKWGAVGLWAAAVTGILFLKAKRLWFYSDSNSWTYYSKGFFFDGTSTSIIFMNAVIDYYSSIGIVMVIGILGLVIIVRRPVWDVHLLNMVMIAAFSIGLMMGEYMVLIFTPMIVILAAEGFVEFFRLLPRLRPAVVPALLAVVLVSAGFSMFMVNHWKDLPTTPGVRTVPTEDEYSAALYIKHQLPEGNLMCNDFYIAKRIAAYGGVYCYPIYSSLLPIFEIIDVDDVEVRLLSVSELSPNSNYLYRPIDPPELAIQLLPYSGISTAAAKETLLEFDFKYAVINNNMPNEIFYHGVTRPSKLFIEVYNQKVTIYRNGLITVSTILAKTPVD